MTTKTTSLPLDRLELSEWRDAAAHTIGIAYANLSTEAQTRLNRIINEEHEKVSALFGHHPWCIRNSTVTTVADQAAYAVPADFRHMLSIVEVGTDGAETRTIIARDLADYENAVDGTPTHPWANRDKPTWYYNGMTDQDPPTQEWARVPVPTSAFTVRIVYRPFLALLNTSGQDKFTVLDARFSSPILNGILSRWHASTKDFEAANFYRALQRDDVEVLRHNDTDTSEDTFLQGIDPAFLRELG